MPCVSGCSCRRRADPVGIIAGFTLLEVLLVIAIVAVLFTIAFGAFRGAKQRAGISRAHAELATLSTALEEFKRHYGDYPHTGGQSPAAAATTLFNALIGIHGPRGLAGGRLNGPVLVELSKFSLEQPLDDSRADDRDASTNAFVDPWGARYFYFYGAESGAGSPAGAPVLFSAGPDGRTGALLDVAGQFASGEQFAGENADNIYAERLP